MSDAALSQNLTSNVLFERLLNSLELQEGVADLSDIITWAESILLDGRAFSLYQHEYQREILLATEQRQCFLKGAQVGITSVVMLKRLYGLISSMYKQGVLYLFPSRGDVLDFSRGRFNPLINDNPDVARFVQDTDSQTIKRIGNAMLYLRGARSTAKIQGTKRTSSQLKSVPVDSIVFDECDEMEPAMIDLALERVSHSDIKEETYLSTPTIPDYGVDALFQTSDQRHWYIKCTKCGKETCLELEFPDCLEETDDGVIRLCQRCRDNVIHPEHGKWRPLYPDKAKDMVGFRISQLNSIFVEPSKILHLFNNPPRGNISEIYNSKLAQAHIAAENRLTIAEIIKLCSKDPIRVEDKGPCYMGADVGNFIHCVISRRHPDRKGGKVVFIGMFKEWSRLSELMTRFNVARCVIDALPEKRLARDFAKAHPGKVFVSYYDENRKGSYAWNESEYTVSTDRTESLDSSHHEIASGNVILPQNSETVMEFAKQCSNVARVLREDPETGSSKYTYIKIGADHYRHAYNYKCIAQQYGDTSVFGDSDLR